MYLCVYVYVLIKLSIYIYMFACVYVYMYVYECIYVMSMCLCVYMCVYINRLPMHLRKLISDFHVTSNLFSNV